MSVITEADKAFLGGGRIDEARPFRPVSLAVLTISDTRDEESDTSGDVLVKRIEAAGHGVVRRNIVRDDIDAIRAKVMEWVNTGEIDAIVTTGGTGITGRDVTPEAIEPLLTKRIEGFSTIFHMLSYQTVGLSTLQSRALAGCQRPPKPGGAVLQKPAADAPQRWAGRRAGRCCRRGTAA